MNLKLRMIVLIHAAVMSFVSCTSIKHTGAHEFGDGYFVLKTGTAAPQKVYAVITEDSVALHPLLTDTRQPLPDVIKTTAIEGSAQDSLALPFLLVRTSIDLDMSTVLFKYRFNRTSLPNQLSSNLNFALYCGYRHDYFKFQVQPDPFKKYKHRVRHFEFDMGVFAGFGSTPMNPSVTQNAIDTEYDGIVFQKGIALFIGSKSFTAGVGIGTDGLMDRNRKYWLYQEKPWLGVMIGLNLTD